MERSALKDFNPYDTGLDAPIRELLSDDGARPARTPCQRDQFLALLAGVPALRKTPGLPGPDGSGPDFFTTLPRCASPLDADLCKAHLNQVFGISNKESLLEFCRKQLCCHNNYLDFEGFWEGRPPFDPTPLTKDGSSFFTVARDFSAQFYELVGHLGYLAWDISESMGHLRAGLACGLLSREEFDELAEHWLTEAQAFHSWEEFAASLVCGALYWDFRQGAELPALQESESLWMRLVCTLLADKNAWGGGLWYVPLRQKNYRLWPAEMKMYLPDWEGPNGCFVTDRISVDGCRVGWCYREDPEPGFPDSGWRFFSGDESEDYIADISHTEVADLNSVCNFDPDVVSLLTAPCRSAFARDENGVFQPEPFSLPEEE